ncbi:hypothetical protein [Streptomyces virginiae]|uniref:hypothetical protein n=1 Tax=Streptomyces virginiae TaxID=1961 RepID=UPI003438FFFE
MTSTGPEGWSHHPSIQRDLRLPFPAPVREASQVGEQIQLLLSAAHACPKRRHLPARP